MSTTTEIKSLVESYLAHAKPLETVIKLLCAPIEAIYDRPDGHDANESEADHTLKQLWKELFRIVMNIPHNAARHQEMFQLFSTLKAKPGPPTPSGLEKREPWKSGGLWEEMHMLGQAERYVTDVWMPNKYKTAISTWQQITKAEFISFIAFMAKLTQAEITNSSFLSLSYFRSGLEDEEQRCSSHRQEADVMVAAAAVWIKYAGSCWYDEIRSGDDWRVFEPGRVIERKHSLWVGDRFVVNLDRWALWKDTFHQISNGSVLGDFEDETRAMAQDAVEVMQKLETIENRQMMLRQI